MKCKPMAMSQPSITQNGWHAERFFGNRLTGATAEPRPIRLADRRRPPRWRGGGACIVEAFQCAVRRGSTAAWLNPFSAVDGRVNWGHIVEAATGTVDDRTGRRNRLFGWADGQPLCCRGGVGTTILAAARPSQLPLRDPRSRGPHRRGPHRRGPRRRPSRTLPENLLPAAFPC
jgi:hypothetical protein